MQIVVGRRGREQVELIDVGDDGEPRASETIPAEAFAARVREREAERPRWVWSDTAVWYRPLLVAGVRVERCHDLRLCHAILRDSALTLRSPLARGGPWEGGPAPVAPPPRGEALFDLDEYAQPAAGEPDPGRAADAAEETLAEHRRQRRALEESSDPGRLRLLLAAESVGALVAAEIRAAGLPWSARVHDHVLTEILGPRPAPGRKPARLVETGERVRAALSDPSVNLDSQQKLLKALGRAGITVRSTSQWELMEHEHPAIEPLLEYKKLSRLLSANGWAWLDEWIVDGRFRPDYLPGGVVTGRWATSGGGALQLPKQVRAAVVADPGWKLVVADVAQLEPRVLAGMAGDRAMAEAARGADRYAGIVASGAVETREEAKYAMLGAMYGATTGKSGRLAPRLSRVYPRAMSLVDAAAREGERGGVVTTLLGRSSPQPGASWREAQAAASQPEASAAEERRALQTGRDWGRFTRNFVVQGTAAEWALCWMGEIRRRLAALGETDAASGAPAAGPVFSRRPHLAFFLHDEIVVHTPAAMADQVAELVAEAARQAGRLLFADFPVDFPLDLTVADSYAETE